MLTDLHSSLKHHHKESYIWALRCSLNNKEEAKEALQESYLKVLEGKAKFDERSEFKTWLFAVIRITVADRRRKQIIEEIKNLGFAELIKRLNEKQHYNEEANNIEGQLLKSLSELSPKQEQVLRLVFYHDFTIEATATVMGISVGSARTHYERGKNNLRQKIKV
ncbi:MAG: RNA polymerase sigma factor [Bacteroidota bacterium]